MDTKEAIFMKGGTGENSYAQLSYLMVCLPILLENGVRSLFSKGFHLHGLLNIADFGCAASPNAFSVISTYDDVVENSCFFAGVPGSFHGRLFPHKSLHLVHSFYSAHWLSQVPKGLTSREGLALNKGNIYISKTSDPIVGEAYLTQFQEDFTKFLRSRSEEVVPNGCAILILPGRQSPDPSSKENYYTWDLIAGAIAALVSEGLIDEEKLDSFNVPHYTPSAKEVQDVVEREGSFAVEHIDSFEVHVEGFTGEKLAKSIRAFTESLITYHFGEELMERIYNKLTKSIVEDLSEQKNPAITVAVVLNKK